MLWPQHPESFSTWKWKLKHVQKTPRALWRVTSISLFAILGNLQHLEQGFGPQEIEGKVKAILILGVTVEIRGTCPDHNWNKLLPSNTQQKWKSRILSFILLTCLARLKKHHSEGYCSFPAQPDLKRKESLLYLPASTISSNFILTLRHLLLLVWCLDHLWDELWTNTSAGSGAQGCTKQPGNANQSSKLHQISVCLPPFLSLVQLEASKPRQSNGRAAQQFRRARQEAAAEIRMGCATAAFQSEQSELTNSWSSPMLLLEHSLVTHPQGLSPHVGTWPSAITPPMNGGPPCRTAVLFSSHPELGFFGSVGFSTTLLRSQKSKKAGLRKPQP